MIKLKRKSVIAFIPTPTAFVCVGLIISQKGRYQTGNGSVAIIDIAGEL
jgi:hypothetical protein